MNRLGEEWPEQVKRAGAHSPGITSSTPDSDLVILGGALALGDVAAVARRRRRVAPLTLGGEPPAPALRRMLASAQWVTDRVGLIGEAAASGRLIDPVYGINTGFGSLAGKRAFSDPQLATELSRRLVESTACGVGPYLDEEIVRATMLILANGLSRGYSGVRPVIVNTLVAMLNRDVFPAIPSSGSLGASGDLAPLSHLALVLSKPPTQDDPEQDSGEAFVAAGNQPRALRKVSGKQAMKNAGIPRIVLGPKEGLALNAPISVSTAVLALAVADAENLIATSEIAIAMSLEGLEGFRDAFLPELHEARGHPGQIQVATAVYDYVRGSRLVDGDADSDPTKQPPQDAYSLRCAPQVLGAVRDTTSFVRQIVEREINAVQDNPLIFPDLPESRTLKAVSGGNFHGEYVAFGADFLAIAITELGSIAERRLFRMNESSLSRNLPDMLVDSKEVGLDCGFMIPQYVAAALVSECKTLSHPDSVDSIPTCGNQEDHVSMSMNASLHARRVVTNIETVVGIELLMAAQALDLRVAGVRVDKVLVELDGLRRHSGYSVQVATAGDSLEVTEPGETREGSGQHISGAVVTIVPDGASGGSTLEDTETASQALGGLRIVAGRTHDSSYASHQIGPASRRVLEFIRSQHTDDGRQIETLHRDTVMYPFIRTMTCLVHEGRFVELAGRPYEFFREGEEKASRLCISQI
jgi:histidine ammonia-lyase